MKKYLMISFLSMLLIFGTNLVAASFPQYTVTDLLKNEVINGDNDFGDLLFIAQPYLATNYLHGVIDNFTVQRYDTMTWIGEQSVRIKNPEAQEMILVNGSQYYFSVEGIYIITDMLNASNTANITALKADDNNITLEITEIPVGFKLVFSKTNFNITGQQVITAGLDVDDDVETGDYKLKYKINGLEKTQNFKVVENLNWTMNIENLTLNNNIKSGEGQYLGRIEVKNNGNTDVELRVAKSGNGSNMINIPQPQTLYRKNSIFIDIQAQVPAITKTGVYGINLNISGGNITEFIKFNITVTDNINPVIESINFSSDYVYVPNDISVVATDNNGVTNVTISYDGQTKYLVKDGNLFTTQIQFSKLSRYVMTFCATDGDGNSVCKDVDKIFTKVVVINDSQTAYQLPSVKFGKYSRIKLFTINQRIPDGIVMSLVDYYTSQLSNSNVTTKPIVRIVDSKGSIKQFPEVGSVTIFETGDIFLEVRADEPINIEGVIRVEMDERFQEISDMTFKVSFKDYDVPEDFTLPWVDGRQVVCSVDDTGNLDTSFYNCVIQYPIGVRPQDISVPTTVDERTKFKNEATEIQTLFDKFKVKTGFYIGIIAFIAFVVLLWGLYKVYWYPYVRFKVGATKSVKTKEGNEL